MWSFYIVGVLQYGIVITENVSRYVLNGLLKRTYRGREGAVLVVIDLNAESFRWAGDALRDKPLETPNLSQLIGA